MALLTRVPEKNLWLSICLGEEKPVEDDPQLINFQSSAMSPVFFGYKFKRSNAFDIDPLGDFDPAIAHPATVGYALVREPPKVPSKTTEVHVKAPPHRRLCTAQEYVEHYVFPVLLPALEALLRQAQRESAIFRKRTKFNALDFLTHYLYTHNPRQPGRDGIETMGDIPFVAEWWKDHPRAPLPLSLLWTDEQAALKIQAFYRGYRARCHPEIQELRNWQKDWRLENEDARVRSQKLFSDVAAHRVRSSSGSRRRSPRSTRSDSQQSMRTGSAASNL